MLSKNSSLVPVVILKSYFPPFFFGLKLQSTNKNQENEGAKGNDLKVRAVLVSFKIGGR